MTAHLWQEAALELSQLCVKTRQAIFVARMIYVRPFVARTNFVPQPNQQMCDLRSNFPAQQAAVLQIPLCGHFRRHVRRIYSAFAKRIKNPQIFKMLFQIHVIIAQSVHVGSSELLKNQIFIFWGVWEV